MSNRTKHVAARMSEEESERLDRVAEALDVPASQVIREAVREKVDQYFQTHPKLQPQAEQAA